MIILLLSNLRTTLPLVDCSNVSTNIRKFLKFIRYQSQNVVGFFNYRCVKIALRLLPVSGQSSEYRQWLTWFIHTTNWHTAGLSNTRHFDANAPLSSPERGSIKGAVFDEPTATVMSSTPSQLKASGCTQQSAVSKRSLSEWLSL